MRLLKLELIGFKSFADKTEVHFDRGVTCVVGPNGCGKSNISDSIRWVLGERSAKLLRGSKMDDVIFNGTDFRKPTALAEVSLTIDNQDRGLPIDYQEVTITRRLYRNGESEYFINRTLCRLKDIQDLILDTGVGSNSYSMIEQGRIDYILSADPEERRFLIEEAAGISKYKVKKDEAIRKLEKTEENRIRLNDIVQEVHKNIQYAERQARRAEKYKENYETLKRLEIQKAFYELNLLACEKGDLEQKKIARNLEVSELNVQLDRARIDHDSLSQELRKIGERYSDANTHCHQVRSKIEQIQQQLQFHQEKRIEMTARKGSIAQELLQIEERLEQTEKEMKAKQSEMESLHQNSSEFTAAHKQSGTELERIETALAALTLQLEQTKSEAFEAATQSSKIRNQYHRIIAFVETGAGHFQKEVAALERLQNEIQKLRLKAVTLHEEQEQRAKQLQVLSEEETKLDAHLSENQKAFQLLQSSSQDSEKVFHLKEARLDLLVKAETNAHTDEKAFLEQCEGLRKDFVNSLRDVIKVQSGYEWAVEAALDSFSRSLIADDCDSAEGLLNEIRQKRPSPMGVLIRSMASNGQSSQQLPKPSHPSVLHSLKELVEIRPEYEKVLNPFLQEIYVIENLPSRRVLQELLPFAVNNRLVAPDGLVLGPHGKIFYRNSASNADGHIKRRSEIESLRFELSKLSEHHRKAEDQIQDLKAKVLRFQKELSAINQQKTQELLQREAVSSALKSLEDRILSLGQESELLLQSRQEEENQQREAALNKEKLEKELTETETRERAILQRQEQFLEEVRRVETQKNDKLRKNAEIETRAKNLTENTRLMEAAQHLLREQKARDLVRKNDLQKESKLIAEREIRLNELDESLTGERSSLESERLREEVSLELIRKEREAAENSLLRAQEARQNQQSAVQKIQNDIHQLDIQHMDLSYREKQIYERLAQTYKINLIELSPAEYPVEGPIESVQTQIEALQSKVDNIGPVNLLAIDEYEELKKRYDFLLAQQKDLEEARESLLETIRKINRTTKGLFEQTFHNVQTAFQEYYQILFRGGLAKLILVDEENPLESGIDIVVRPPGKKLQHISLLSGGEKALTAIALLFALFKIKPSPFCVLDEVDAPLDEANIDRFLTVLKTFLGSTQFIIVTHNRKTIAMGDSLYGITMEEPGISKIVSVKMHSESAESPTGGNEDSKMTGAETAEIPA